MSLKRYTLYEGESAGGGGGDGGRREGVTRRVSRGCGTTTEKRCSKCIPRNPPAPTAQIEPNTSNRRPRVLFSIQ